MQAPRKGRRKTSRGPKSVHTAAAPVKRRKVLAASMQQEDDDNVCANFSEDREGSLVAAANASGESDSDSECESAADRQTRVRLAFMDSHRAARHNWVVPETFPSNVVQQVQ